MVFNFKITSKEIISSYFKNKNIFDFAQASNFIQNLPYKRNHDKTNKLCVLNDCGGTCSTKHALLKELAIENNFEELKLMLGIFNMNFQNTPKISKILTKYNLIEIPEAHNYFKIGENYLDFTRENSKPEDFLADLKKEIEIQTYQITDFKLAFHKDYLKKYLIENPQIIYNLENFWIIREESIAEFQA
ncbi:hypothetical protein [Halpernia sp.]|uniref:hypothetical protein n=1 Tax=Halpernia sp. TaxID=2782209 RepID=UPI003A8DD737